MRAMVYHGANDIRFEEKPRSQIIDPIDAVVKIVKTTICGTDLGIWKGKNPEVADGRILGHEGIGIVEEVGEAVKNIKVGDKVIISCVSKCCTCDNCKIQLYSHCRNGGWILGYMIDGTQAEYVRTPYADNSLVPLPDNVNEEVALLLSDALPTAHEIGVQYGDVKPGDTVFIAGAGPVGMSALLTAQLYSPAAIIAKVFLYADDEIPAGQDHPYRLEYFEPTEQEKGLIQCLWDTFGGVVNSKGYKVLDSHIGAIYGDSITYQRMMEIFERLERKGFASSNVVFGIGSYTYQYVTRDVLGFAVKCTAVTIGGDEHIVFKAPKTDSKKKSQRGRVKVVNNGDSYVDNLYSDSDYSDDVMQTIFKDGKLLVEDNFQTLRERAVEDIQEH